MKYPIISIDWDHTFRNMHGLDLNILALVCYAKAKNIPVGLTTHRDIENTTLYTLYHWQRMRPDDDKTALAAAIYYWQSYLFDAINIKFDFINARYQPKYLTENYYEKKLLAHEKMLSMMIKEQNLLADRDKIKKVIDDYQQREDMIDHNEFKGSQINWLVNYFSHHFNGAIYHIDDSREVCDFLVDEYNKVNLNPQTKIHTIFYDNAPLFYNEQCALLLRDIGLLDDWNAFLANDCAPFDDNQCLYLALCLLATQISYNEKTILDKVANNLNKLEISNIANKQLMDLIHEIISKITNNQQPVHYYLNEWVKLEHECNNQNTYQMRLA